MRDEDILAALSGMIQMQRTACSDVELCVETGLVFLRVYYEKLPAGVARRLTELKPEVLARIPAATGEHGSREARAEIAASVAGEAARAQAVRAANSYRRKLGLAPLGPDGTEGQEGGSNEQG